MATWDVFGATPDRHALPDHRVGRLRSDCRSAGYRPNVCCEGIAFDTFGQSEIQADRPHRRCCRLHIAVALSCTLGGFIFDFAGWFGISIYHSVCEGTLLLILIIQPACRNSFREVFFSPKDEVLDETEGLDAEKGFALWSQHQKKPQRNHQGNYQGSHKGSQEAPSLPVLLTSLTSLKQLKSPVLRRRQRIAFRWANIAKNGWEIICIFFRLDMIINIHQPSCFFCFVFLWFSHIFHIDDEHHCRKILMMNIFIFSVFSIFFLYFFWGRAKVLDVLQVEDIKDEKDEKTIEPVGAALPEAARQRQRARKTIHQRRMAHGKAHAVGCLWKGIQDTDI